MCLTCREKHSKSEAARKAADPRHAMIHSAKRRAKINGLPFNLAPEDFVIPAMCPVLGIPLKVGTLKQGPSSPTLDRIIPARGYVKGNVRVISWRANDLRRDASADELEAVARYARWAEEQSWVDPTVTPEEIREAMTKEDELTKAFSVRSTALDLLTPLD
jgi:hypothetical protein